jgi:hypothetical protein
MSLVKAGFVVTIIGVVMVLLPWQTMLLMARSRQNQQ